MAVWRIIKHERACGGACDGWETPPIPKEEKLERVSTFFLLAIIHPMRMPGHCRPLVHAPAMKTLLLSRSLTYWMPLIDGEWYLCNGNPRHDAPMRHGGGSKAATVRRRFERRAVHLVRLVEQDAVLRLLGHRNQLLQLRASARVACTRVHSRREQMA